MAADPTAGDSREDVGPSGSDRCLHVIATPGLADYALLDSGNGRKLERFGRFTVDRPEPQAMWQAALEPGRWLRADATFKPSGGEEDGEGRRWHKSQPAAGDLGVEACSTSPCSPGSPASATWASSPSSAAGGGCWSGSATFAARRPRPQPLRLYGCGLPDRGPCGGGGDARRHLQAGDHLGQAEPGRLQALRGDDPLDPPTTRASSSPARCGAARATT